MANGIVSNVNVNKRIGFIQKPSGEVSFTADDMAPGCEFSKSLEGCRVEFTERVSAGRPARTFHHAVGVKLL